MLGFPFFGEEGDTARRLGPFRVGGKGRTPQNLGLALGEGGVGCSTLDSRVPFFWGGGCTWMPGSVGVGALGG